MESSGIATSLKELLETSAGHLRCLGLLALCSVGPFWELAAQAPSAGAYASPELPRFTMREIVTGRNDSLARIPGRWLNAASATLPESSAMIAYHRAAVRSGVSALRGSALASEHSQHVMGLYHRAELTGASRRTLEAIRTTLPSDTIRARFDRLFRPRGEWIVDLHDAALDWARTRAPNIGWESARRSLTATHWLQKTDTLPIEAVPRGLYSLTVLAATDSAAFEGVRSDLLRADSASTAAVLLLLNGYVEARQWYTDALRFFLTQAWIPDTAGGRSLADYVLDDWGGTAASKTATAVPEIRARIFGYPQAVPHYGVPSALFERLIVADNASAREWLDRHGEAGLLRALRSLPQGDTSLVLLQTGSEAIRLTTVPRQSRESLNGFLEPIDVIAIDPGYSPLLALGTVVHEWQHLLFRSRQLARFTARRPSPTELVVELPGVDPYLAEGFAEWSTERILAPLVERWPLLALGELEKRAGLAQDLESQHFMGYALVRALAAALPGPAATTDMLLRHPERLSDMMAQPGLRRVWRRYRRAPDRVFVEPTRRILIPEVTFTIEDGFPDVIGSRILVPPSAKRGR